MSEVAQTADRAMAILVELSHGSAATPQELARRLGLNRSVVHRLLMTLLDRGFITRNSDGYRLASQVVRLAEHVEPELRNAAVGPLEELVARRDLTAFLQIQDGNDGVVLLEVLPKTRGAMIVRHEVGARSPLVRWASGRALLAHLDPAVTARIIRGEPDPGLLHDELAEIRRRGFAITEGANNDGYSGIAVPVQPEGRPARASIGVVVPAPFAAQLTDLVPDMQRAAKFIALGLS